MKILLRGRSYEMAAIDRLTLLDWMSLETETTAMGRPMKWSELRALLEGMDDAMRADEDFDPETDDRFPWFLGILVWATLRNAGQTVSFGEAVNIPMGEIEIVPDGPKAPQDHKAKGGGKGPRKARAAAASVRAAEPLTAAESPASP